MNKQLLADDAIDALLASALDLEQLVREQAGKKCVVAPVFNERVAKFYRMKWILAKSESKDGNNEVHNLKLRLSAIEEQLGLLRDDILTHGDWGKYDKLWEKLRQIAHGTYRYSPEELKTYGTRAGFYGVIPNSSEMEKMGCGAEPEAAATSQLWVQIADPEKNGCLLGFWASDFIDWHNANHPENILSLNGGKIVEADGNSPLHKYLAEMVRAYHAAKDEEAEHTFMEE